MEPLHITASTTYMTIVELFDEWPGPSSHEMIVTITSILNDTIVSMGTERNTKTCCWGE